MEAKAKVEIKEVLTAEVARAILSYDPDTGQFTWRKRRGRRGKEGAIATAHLSCNKTKTAYRAIRLTGKPASHGFTSLANGRQINHRTMYLGFFDNPEEAHSAYCNAAVEMFGEFARFK